MFSVEKIEPYEGRGRWFYKTLRALKIVQNDLGSPQWGDNKLYYRPNHQKKIFEILRFF